MARGPKIGELLLQAGLIDEFQLQSALGQQQRWGGRLGRALVQLGFIDEGELIRVLSGVLGVPVARLADKRPSPETLDLLPVELAEKHSCLPLFTKREGGGNTLYLGIEDPSDLAVQDELAFRIGMKVKPVLVGSTELREAIARLYRHRASGEAEEPSSFAETLIEPGDTAPVLATSFPEPVSPRVPTPAPESPLDLDEPVVESPPTAPAQPHAPELAPAASSPAAEALPLEPPKPGRVPMRAILRALTHLLIEKGVIGREELMERIGADGSATEGGDTD
jgi:type IV pilus assembly protein PilB